MKFYLWHFWRGFSYGLTHFWLMPWKHPTPDSWMRREVSK